MITRPAMQLEVLRHAIQKTACSQKHKRFVAVAFRFAQQIVDISGRLTPGIRGVGYRLWAATELRATVLKRHIERITPNRTGIARATIRPNRHPAVTRNPSLSQGLSDSLCSYMSPKSSSVELDQSGVIGPFALGWVP